MKLADDSELLRSYIREHSEEAFAELVDRYIDLVNSVALRQVGDAHHAEEIAQAVFIVLARKAERLQHDKALSSWLFQTTRFTAHNFMRSELRRQRREREAGTDSALSQQETEVWPHIAHLLDPAVESLNEIDRRAILLKFYQGCNLREVAAALGASEVAAEKRVSRALEKLRRFFKKRGVGLPTTAIVGAVSACSIQAAPPGLAKTISVVAAAKGAMAGGSTLALVKGGLKFMAWTKAKTAIVVGATILFAAGTTIVVEKNYSGEPHYQGKPLSAWLEKIATLSEGRQTAITVAEHTELSEAQAAVNHIGLRAVPPMLRWATTTNTIGQSLMPGYELARIGFNTLGPKAQPAVPRLTTLLTNESFLIRGGALVDLSAIGNGASDALPYVLNCLTNDPVPYIRYWAAGLVGNIGTRQPEVVIPVLVAQLNPTNNSTLRGNSMSSLAKFQSQADELIPLFVDLLSSTNDEEIRVESLRNLGRFHDSAKMAVPYIAACLNDQSPQVRLSAANSLRVIDRDAAIAAGVPVHGRIRPQNPN